MRRVPPAPESCHVPRRSPYPRSGGASRPARGHCRHLAREEAHDAAFDAILQEVGVALETDPILGGLAFGLTYGRPETSIEAVAGAPAIKGATLAVTVDYETDAPLA